MPVRGSISIVMHLLFRLFSKRRSILCVTTWQEECLESVKMRKPLHYSSYQLQPGASL